VIWTGGIFTGKTVWASVELFDYLTVKMRGALAWWIAPQRFNLAPMWRIFKRKAVAAGARTRKSPYLEASFDLQGGGTFQGVTAKNYDMILSEHPDIVVIDEAGRLPKRVWDLIHARLVGASKVIVMGSMTDSPDLQRVIRMAKTGKRWAFLHVNTLEAGILSRAELKRLKSEVPTDVWEQDVLGLLRAGAGAVFKGIDRLCTGVWRSPPKNPKPAEFEVTWDVAQTQDWSVVGVWRGKTLLWADRWQYEDYTAQVDRVAWICRRWGGATCYMDATGPGIGPFDFLSAQGAKSSVVVDGQTIVVPKFEVVPIVFTAENKPTMIMAAQRCIEEGGLTLIDPEYGPPYDVIVDEMRQYTRTRSASGIRYTYAAPDGHNDDCVIMVVLRFAGAMAPGIEIAGREPTSES
jgi:hypothetical protein